MKSIRFTFLVDSYERQMIRDLSDKLQRSQGATLRFLLHYLMKQLDKEPHHFEGPVSGEIEE